MRSIPLRLAAVLAAVLVALGLSACGGDDDEGSTTDTTAADDGTTSTTSGGADSGDGSITLEGLRTCLTDAGLEPVDEDALPFGVEDPVERLTVTLEAEGTTTPLRAELYVFESAEAAQDNRPVITLQNEDDARNKVVANVLLSYTIIPSYDPEGSALVEACLTG